MPGEGSKGQGGGGGQAKTEAAVVRVMNYTLAEGHDDEVPVIRKPEECPSVAQLSLLTHTHTYPYTYPYIPIYIICVLYSCL